MTYEQALKRMDEMRKQADLEHAHRMAEVVRVHITRLNSFLVVHLSLLVTQAMVAGLGFAFHWLSGAISFAAILPTTPVFILSTLRDIRRLKREQLMREIVGGPWPPFVPSNKKRARRS